MARTWNSSIENQKESGDKNKYLEENNIVDITKENLLKIKKDLPIEKEANIDNKIKEIDKDVEAVFDGQLKNGRDEEIILIVNGQTITKYMRDIIMEWDQATLNALANVLINKSWYENSLNTIEDQEIKNALRLYKFELRDLRNDVPGSNAFLANKPNNKTTESYADDTDTEEKKSRKEKKEKKNKNKEQEEKKEYDMLQHYVDPHDENQQWGYVSIDKKRDIANIYRDNKLAKYMENIFDDEDLGELRRGKFRVNLDKEDGLAGIIIAIRESEKYKDKDDDNTKIYNALWAITTDGMSEKEIKKQLKELFKDNTLHYKRKWWGDLEINKIAKILARAKREDLDAFASLLQSKDDIPMIIKEWNNALEMTGNSRERSEQESLITKDNVLEFLCDFNSDGQISMEYNRRHNKEQRNQWDVGTLTWWDINFTIEQAIRTKNVELGKSEDGEEGEQRVIFNIVKNMDISDKRNLDSDAYEFLVAMQADPKNCTKENLTKLLNGDTDIPAMPELKMFFLDAIRTINGGSQAIQPDLYDTLVGSDADRIIELDNTENDIKNIIDKRLTTSLSANDPEQAELRKAIRDKWLIYVRETIFTQLMKALDYVTITTNDGAQTNLQAAGISKSRELRSAKKDVMEDMTKHLIGWGIHFSARDGLRLTVGIGQEGKSESGRTTRNRWAQTGAVISPESVNIYLGLWGEIAEQYNYKKVINANLSHITSAQYLGLEWWAAASAGRNRGIGIEAFWGIKREQDLETGINQVDEQYRTVSQIIFDVSQANKTTLQNKDSFISLIANNIDHPKANEYTDFINKNKQHLHDNLDFIVDYMERNGFFEDTGKIATLKGIYPIDITINSLLDILQSGNIEERRHDLIAGLHGKLELSKLSFGVTTNALTLWGQKIPSNPNATDVDGTDEYILPSDQSNGTDRLGIAGFYIGMRLSTWVNRYIPNDQQYLYTHYEIAKGTHAEHIEAVSHDLNRYAAYLQAFYNRKDLRCWKDSNTDKLIIHLDTDTAPNLQTLLSIYATDKAEGNYSLDNNTLTIGNVGDIGIYTVTTGKGVQRILSLGSKQTEGLHRVTQNTNTLAKNIPEIERKSGYQERSKEKIMSDIISKMSGPSKYLENAKTDAASFFDATWAFTVWNHTIHSLNGIKEWQKLKNWTLTITKRSDNTYDIVLNTTATNTLSISYINEAWNFDTNIDLKFDQHPEINTVFETYKKGLSTFDNKDEQGYRKFMESIVDAWIDGVIDTSDYNSAFTNINQILQKNKKSYTEMTELQWLMNKTDLSLEEKKYIVDMFKATFSYIPTLTDGKEKDWATLKYLIWRRWNIYKGMVWPSGEKYPLNHEYRQDILNTLQSKNKLDRIAVDDLVGFTAFYKLNGEARKYALTPLGGTNILGYNGNPVMEEIQEEDKTKAQDWFMKNLEKNPESKATVWKAIKDRLFENEITLPKEKEAELIKSLLLWNTISLDSWQKISIDINRLFYLLGECGNESIGMKIGGLHISGEATYYAEGTPQPEDTYMDLYAKSHSITINPYAKKRKVDLRHHHSLLKTPPPPPPTEVDPNLPPAPLPTEVDPIWPLSTNVDVGGPS